MIKIIIVAHGNFPDGILSSLELIAGHQEYVVGINFIAGMSSNDVRVALQREVIDFKEILVLTDLLGGTPFNVSSALSVEYTDKKIKVLSGLNLSMLMEAVLSRTMFEHVDDLVDDLVDKVITSSHEGIVDFSTCLATQTAEATFEGGI